MGKMLTATLVRLSALGNQSQSAPLHLLRVGPSPQLVVQDKPAGMPSGEVGNAAVAQQPASPNLLLATRACGALGATNAGALAALPIAQKRPLNPALAAVRR